MFRALKLKTALILTAIIAALLLSQAVMAGVSVSIGVPSGGYYRGGSSVSVGVGSGYYGYPRGYLYPYGSGYRFYYGSGYGSPYYRGYYGRQHPYCCPGYAYPRQYPNWPDPRYQQPYQGRGR